MLRTRPPLVCSGVSFGGKHVRSMFTLLKLAVQTMDSLFVGAM
uniref:Uncharacterized protein n=1 Tax=Anguilla anguilla TaxID=7936 RepID=A0A0E9TYV2_ANGAN